MQVLLTLVPICIGVSLIVYGASMFNLIGFASAFAANLASASRNVYYKSKLDETKSSSPESPSSSSPVSPFMAFLNVGFVSFILYLPFYVLQGLSFLLLSPDSSTSLFSDFATNFFLSSDALKLLALGSFFNFLYNLFSLKVLSNVAPISHSVINIMKRVFIVICSTLVFSTQITSMQWMGMVCADIGVFSYSIMKLRHKAVKVTILGERKILYKKMLVFIVGIILLASCFLPVDSAEPIESNLTRHLVDKEDLDLSARGVCIKKIRGNYFYGVLYALNFSSQKFFKNRQKLNNLAENKRVLGSRN